ncbi:hypothetical protein C8R43DRAFT_1032271 [Mycena crocata]|nr:hypothetical protein C8R43DRAFT_1032271 [Mycena crocata]
MSSTIPSESFIPTPPFDDPDADVILRSADGVDFRVHRLVLSLASPFFKGMFTLPQPNSVSPTIPTISMAESAAVLDRALRFWYPGAEPTEIASLDELREVLEALVLKYDMQFLVPSSKKHLREYLEQDPVAVFAIACRHGWKEIALEAAKHSLKLPLRTFELIRPGQLNCITADTYHTLLQYHSQCAKAATAATSALNWTPYTDIPGSGCTNWADSTVCPRTGTWLFANRTLAPIAEWFAHYLQRVTDDLAKSPAAKLDGPKLLSGVIAEIAPCSFCRLTGFDEVTRFHAEVLRPKIERVINSVELTLDL